MTERELTQAQLDDLTRWWSTDQDDTGEALEAFPHLLAMASRLLELESAMAYIQVNTGINGGTARLSYRGMLNWAEYLGWKGGADGEG